MYIFSLAKVVSCHFVPKRFLTHLPTRYPSKGCFCWPPFRTSQAQRGVAQICRHHVCHGGEKAAGRAQGARCSGRGVFMENGVVDSFLFELRMGPISFDSSAKWWQERFWWWWTTSQNELTGEQHGATGFLFVFAQSSLKWTKLVWNTNYQTNYQTPCLEIPPDITRTIKLCLGFRFWRSLLLFHRIWWFLFRFSYESVPRGRTVAPKLRDRTRGRFLKAKAQAEVEEVGVRVANFWVANLGQILVVLAGLDPWIRFLGWILCKQNAQNLSELCSFGVILTGEAETRKWTQRKGEKEETQGKVQRRRTTSAPVQGAAVHFRESLVGDAFFRIQDRCKFPYRVE